MHRVETTHTCGIYGSFGTTCHHYIGFAETDKVECIDDGVIR